MKAIGILSHRRIFLLLKSFCTFFLIIPLTPISAQDEINNYTKPINRYSFGVIPAAAYDSDLGIKYGGVLNFFDYGINAKSRDYKQYLFIKLTNTTKGTLNAQALLESETLISKAKVFAEISYLKDKNLDFFGFNGTNAVYSKDFVEPGHRDFVNKAFYAHQRGLLRVRFDVQKYLSGSKLRFLAGFTFNGFTISPHKGENEFENGRQLTLYENYKLWSIIKPEESAGGNIGLLKMGLIYDTRNDRCYCTNGKWLELLFIHSPELFSDQSFTKMVFTYRQHIGLFNDNITFSLRASVQQKLAGDIPFYLLPTFFDSRLSQDGVGGAYSLRGALRNRIAADGFFTGNFELKFKTYDFKFLRQDFSCNTSVFYDNAIITQNYQFDLQNVSPANQELLFNNHKQKWHHTAGVGLYLIFNKNNVISVNYGLPINKQLGNGGLYIGSSLLF